MLLNKHKSGNLFDLIQAKYFLKDERGIISFAKLNKLPDKKIIILSASKPIEYYTMLFGDRVIATDIPMLSKLITLYSLPREVG